MKKNLSILLGIAICILLTNCNQKFNKSKWIDGDGVNYAYRNSMVNSLLENYNLKGLNYQEIKTLLGEADGKDSTHIWYDIKVDYGSDIDPVYIKTLILRMGEDSVVKDLEVKEWKKP